MNDPHQGHARTSICAGITLPELPRRSVVSWYDCQAWAIRENQHLVTGRSRVTTVLGCTQIQCEKLDLVIDWSPRLDGLFYVVQIDLDRNADEFKLGFSTNVNRRLSNHKTIAPNAEHIIDWPTRKAWGEDSN